MEQAFEEKKQRRWVEKRIPIEIVKEIFERLPLKSLSRFKCASKLCSSLIKQIIHRRLHEEMDRRLRKVHKMRMSGSFLGLEDKMEELRGDGDGLRWFRDQLRGNLDEIMCLVTFPDDINRYHDSVDEMRDNARSLRDGVVTFARDAEKLLDDVDSLVVEAQMWEEVDAMPEGENMI